MRRDDRSVEAAFGFGDAAPAPGPVVLAGAHLTRAGPASHAWVPLVVAWVVRHIVLDEMIPDVLLGPAHERVHLGDLELRVPFDHQRVCALRRLLASKPWLRDVIGVMLERGLQQLMAAAAARHQQLMAAAAAAAALRGPKVY